MKQEIYKIEKKGIVCNAYYKTRKKALDKIFAELNNDDTLQLQDFHIFTAIVEVESELESLAEKVLAIINSNDQNDASFNINTAGDIVTINRKSRFLPLCSSTLKRIVELMEQNKDYNWWVDSYCNVNLSQRTN